MEAIHGRQRAAVSAAVSRGEPVPDMPLHDHREVERLEAEIAQLAAILEQSDPGVTAPLSIGIGEREIVQAYRLDAETERLSEPPPRRPARFAAHGNPDTDERRPGWEVKPKATAADSDRAAGAGP